MRPLFLTILVLTMVAGAARAQPQSEIRSGPNVEVLIRQDEGWRVHAGDDPIYAAATWNDASWLQTTIGDVLPDFIGTAGSRWFRKRIELPPEAGPIDLLIIGTQGSFEVYLDGKRVGAPILPSIRWQKGQEVMLPIRTSSNPGQSSVEVAIRSHLYPSEFSDSLSFEQIAIGTPGAVAIAARAHEGVRTGKLVVPIGMLTAMSIAAMLLFTLYSQQRAHLEYLWLGFSLLFFALTTGLPAIDIYGGAPYSWNAFLGDPCTYFLSLLNWGSSTASSDASPACSSAFTRRFSF